MQKLWGGNFDNKTDNLANKFTCSKDVYSVKPCDYKLLPYDIRTNKAHIYMLLQKGFLNQDEYDLILKELENIKKLYDEGNFDLNPDLEDIHTNIENILIKKIGIDIAGKIHTARSRNDQALTDIFLYLHEKIDFFIKKISDLILVLKEKSIIYKSVICPGFTHYQYATITTFGQILDSYYISIKRDLESFKYTKSKFNFSTLGAMTGYGTTLNIDPNISAKQLGYENIFENSIDIITNRGEFEYYFAFNISSLLDHISSLSQTFIIFSMPSLGFIKLSDMYSTGSSVMPHKKNPDILEIIKAKAAFANSILSGILSIKKNSFIGYNRDIQQTKSMIMDLIEETIDIPVLVQKIIETMYIDKNQMHRKCYKGFVTVTGLMEQIINNKKIPMRLAKKLIEHSVKISVKNGNNDQISYNDLMKASDDLKILVDISEKEFNKWIDPYNQVDLILKNYSKSTKIN